MNHQIQTNTPQSVQLPPSNSKIFDANDLLGSGHEVQIKLDSQVYTLRRTRFGKLLLTK